MADVKKTRVVKDASDLCPRASVPTREHPVDERRQPEVRRRQPAHAVARQLHGDPAPGHEEIGMVALGLGTPATLLTKAMPPM
jgi:hypothetical protein